MDKLRRPWTDLDVYQERRQRVIERLGGGVLVLPAALPARRSGGAAYTYRQDSDLLYLTGFCEPESVLVSIGAWSSGSSVRGCATRVPAVARGSGLP